MAKDKLTDYSATNGSNTDIGGINIDEGMLPSAVNNALREILTHLKNFASGTDGIDVLSLADDDASAAMKLQAPASVTSDTTLTLPDGDGADGQALITDGSGTLAWAYPYGNRSLVINGSMRAAQRGTSSSVSDGSNEGYQTLDRFAFYYGNNAGGVATVSQSTDVPSGYGFTNSYKVDVTTADTSISSTHTIFVSHAVEAQDVANSGWNHTSSSSYMTLSFWAKSVKAGTYCVAIVASDSASNRIFVKEYTLVANTWKKIEVTFPGESGVTVNNDNGVGLQIKWALQSGTDRDNATDNTWNSSDTSAATSNQVNFFDSTSNNFFLTGVQLEVGEQATPFEHRSFGDELARCQRYLYQPEFTTGGTSFANSSMYTSSMVFCHVPFPVTMRTPPSVSFSSVSNGFRAYSYGQNDDFTDFDGIQDNGTTGNALFKAGLSSVQGAAGWIQMTASGTYVRFDAEL